MARRVRSAADFLLAGRSLGYVLATFTIFATWFGAETCIGAAGCWQTEADTLVEAERVVALRASGAAVAGPIKAGGESDTSTGTIHVTGCDKRCATRGPVATTFIGRTDGSGFDEVASRARATFT